MASSDGDLSQTASVDMRKRFRLQMYMQIPTKVGATHVDCAPHLFSISAKHKANDDNRGPKKASGNPELREGKI